jgi:hypothetical protein
MPLSERADVHEERASARTATMAVPLVAAPRV